jgi:hypothetical protein
MGGVLKLRKVTTPPPPPPATAALKFNVASNSQYLGTV